LFNGAGIDILGGSATIVKATRVLRQIRSQFEQFSTLGLDVFSTIQHRAFSNQL